MTTTTTLTRAERLAARETSSTPSLFVALLGASFLLGGPVACGSADTTETEDTDQTEAAISVDEIMQIASSVPGYSYYWGHGRWRWDGASHGSCSGGCPSCSHSGSYGADCSGFVAKAWQVPGPSALETDTHPYSTQNFRFESTHWDHIDRASAQTGDAMVYRENGSGHIFLYEKGDPWGSMWAYECKGCSAGCVHNIRSAGGNYVAIRRHGVSGGGGGGDANCEANCAKVGCVCVDGQCGGGYCPGTGCTAEETANCGNVGCGCTDHQCQGGIGCGGSNCTALEVTNCAAFGTACVDHGCNGGYAPGTGCSVQDSESCGTVGCACVDGECNGGYCPGAGCTALEIENCGKFACGCVDHQCSGGYGCSAQGNGCTALEVTNCGNVGCGCYDHQCSGGFCP